MNEWVGVYGLGEAVWQIEFCLEICPKKLVFRVVPFPIIAQPQVLVPLNSRYSEHTFRIARVQRVHSEYRIYALEPGSWHTTRLDRGGKMWLLILARDANTKLSQREQLASSFHLKMSGLYPGTKSVPFPVARSCM